MEPLSALAITTLAFISVKASETVIEKFTEAALDKANKLREKIWNKLKGRPEAEKALQAAKNGSQEDLEAVADYLKIAMREDPEFRKEIEELAKEVEAGKIEDKSTMTQINRDQSKGFQTKVEGGTAYIGEIHIQGSAPQSD